MNFSLRLKTLSGAGSSEDIGVCETQKVKASGRKMWARRFCRRRRHQWRKGAMMCCAVRGCDWKGDRGCVGACWRSFWSRCVHECLCVSKMVDLEKCTASFKDVLCRWLQLLDCWFLRWMDRGEHHTKCCQHTHTLTHSTLVFHKWCSYSAEPCCYIRGCSQNLNYWSSFPYLLTNQHKGGHNIFLSLFVSLGCSVLIGLTLIMN